MRVLIVSHYFESHRGGVEIVAGQLARSLALLGLHVTWIASAINPPPDDPGAGMAVPMATLNWTEEVLGTPYPIPLPNAVRLLRQEVAKSDLVFLQDGFYLPCFLAANAARRHNKPVVVMQHIGVVAYRAAILRIAMNMLDKVSTRPLLERADRVVFISALTRSYYADLRYHRPPEIIFNGVDAAVFHPLPGSFDRARNRRALGADPSSPCILFVGRFVEKKGLHHIEAMARAQPDWTWILAGWGPLDPRQWSLPNVQVIGGLSGPTLATLYQHADSLVLPSIGEGYPLVIQEALACGLPVVCSEVTAQADPAASEYIIGATMHEDSRMTASAFIQKLEAIVSIDDGTEFENRRKRALFAATRYNWATAAQRLKEIFNQAIASHRGLGA